MVVIIIILMLIKIIFKVAGKQRHVISVKINCYTSPNSPMYAVKKRSFSSTHEKSSIFYSTTIPIQLTKEVYGAFSRKKSLAYK